MDCAVLDIGGNFLGPALGLRQLGHRVGYWTDARIDGVRDLAAMAGMLLEEPAFEADVVIYSASFSDEQWAAELGIQLDAQLRPEEPLHATIHPGQASYRNRWIASRVPKGQQLVLVDMGDAATTSSPFFHETPAIKLKRELTPGRLDPGIHAFPYLYQPQLLLAEWNGLLDRLRTDALQGRFGERRREALFAGSVGHWRYMGRRAFLIEQWRSHHSDLPLRLLQGGATFRQVWQQLLTSELALSLPGRGQLCFRHHEIAALGVPAMAAQDFRIEVPPAWHQAWPVRRSEILCGDAMLRFYREHYHPMQAARQLIALVGDAAGADAGDLQSAAVKQETGHIQAPA